jgi:hypothetical protein
LITTWRNFLDLVLDLVPLRNRLLTGFWWYMFVITALGRLR